MSNLTKAQRVYDAKMERKLDHWAEERNAAQNMAAGGRKKEGEYSYISSFPRGKSVTFNAGFSSR